MNWALAHSSNSSGVRSLNIFLAISALYSASLWVSPEDDSSGVASLPSKLDTTAQWPFKVVSWNTSQQRKA